MRHGAPQVIIRAYVGQCPVQGAENKIVHQPAIPEAHFMLGGVHIHIHSGRVHFQVQHEGRVTVVVEYIPVGLAHGVGHQLVANNPAVDEKILKIRLGTGERWQRHPAP